MSAYQSMRYDDLLVRQQGGETLSERDQRTLAYLDTLAKKDWEQKDRPRWLGGDYPDL